MDKSLDNLYARVDTTYIKNSSENGANEMAKRTKKREVSFGDPLNWGPRTKPVLHPFQCPCYQCEAGIKWAKGYQEYLRKVDRR